MVYASSPVAQPALQARIGSPGAFGGQDFRQGHGPNHLPGDRVPEEAGDVDEDGVEQRSELAGWTSRYSWYPAKLCTPTESMRLRIRRASEAAL